MSYVYETSQALEPNLYADDSYLLFQKKETTEIKTQLSKDFANICDWSVDNKLNRHFKKGKTKSILFSSERYLKSVEELDIRYKEIEMKQHKHVNYLGCVLDETVLGETMACRITEKINSRQKFLSNLKSDKIHF